MPTYTYTPNTPYGPNPFNQTQSPILNNFEAIFEWAAIDHYGLDQAYNIGKHRWLHLPQQTNPFVVPDTTTNEISLFCMETPPPGANQCELFMQYPFNETTGLPGVQLQLSPPSTTNPLGTYGTSNAQQITNNSTSVVVITSNYIQFSSGILFRFGPATNVVPNTANYIVYSSAPLFQVRNSGGLVTATQPGVLYVASGMSIGGGMYGSNWSNIFLDEVANQPSYTFNYFTMGM